MSLLLALLLSAAPPGEVDWFKDYGVARTEARKQNRLILLHFFLPGRPVCKAMDEETFRKAEVLQALAEGFIACRADIEASSTLFESTIGGRGGLATCVVDATGDVISARYGYAGPEEFLGFLEKAASGHGRIQAAREALRRSPAEAGLLLSLGEAYRQSGSLRRAEDCYVRALESADLSGLPVEKGTLAVCHDRMARFQVQRGKNLDARQHLEAARKLDPEGRSAGKDRLQLTEGLILAVERRHAEAARVLQEGIRLYPDSEESDHLRYALGFVLHQGSQDKPALEALESVVRLYPRSSWVVPAREQIEHIRNPQPDHVH